VDVRNPVTGHLRQHNFAGVLGTTSQGSCTVLVAGRRDRPVPLPENVQWMVDRDSSLPTNNVCLVCRADSTKSSIIETVHRYSRRPCCQDRLKEVFQR